MYLCTNETNPSQLPLQINLCMPFTVDPVHGIVTTDAARQYEWPEMMGIPYEQAREVLSAAGMHPQMVPRVRMRSD